jgi:hypothetical protein
MVHLLSGVPRGRKHTACNGRGEGRVLIPYRVVEAAMEATTMLLHKINQADVAQEGAQIMKNTVG